MAGTAVDRGGRVLALSRSEAFDFGVGGVEIGLELVAFGFQGGDAGIEGGFEFGYALGLVAGGGALPVPVVALPFGVVFGHKPPSRDYLLVTTLTSRDGLEAGHAADSGDFPGAVLHAVSTCSPLLLQKGGVETGETAGPRRRTAATD